MPRNWSALAERSDLYEEADFQSAAYELVCAQILYETDASQRRAYRLISDYRPEFKEAMALFGLNLVFDDALRFVAAIPERGRKVVLTLQESQLVLVLRKLYHEQATRGVLEEGGLAIVTIDELRAAFTAATGRELPSTIRDLGALIDQMQRFGLAKQVRSEDSVQPFDIMILPGITALVNEAALMKLAGHYEAAAALESVRKTADVPTDGSSAQGAESNTEEVGT